MRASRRLAVLGVGALAVAFGCSGSTGADASDGGPADLTAELAVGGDAGDAGAAPGSDAAPDTPADRAADGPLVNATITQLTPSSLSLGSGSASFTLTVDGRDIPSDAYVAFDTNIFATTFVSSMRVTAEIPSAALGATPRQVVVRVTRVGTPALTSNALTFDILPAGSGDAAAGN